MATLHHYPLDPFCRRIRLWLAEQEISVELADELPWSPRQPFLTLNPSGILPVFVDDDGSAICGVEAVSEYLEETRIAKDGKSSLLGATPAQRAETRRLIAWFDVRFFREVGRPILTEKIERRFAKPEEGGGAPNMTAVRAGLQNIRPHLSLIGALM
ncbi:MAG: glutathione S-transferase family protein, partial [Pseudomonadota bacterium]